MGMGALEKVNLTAKTTLNTGDLVNERTVREPVRLT